MNNSITLSKNKTTNTDQNFKKQHRLLSPNEFKAVFDAPIKKIHSMHLLAFIAKNHANTPRLGLAITKKKLKKAVDRNRLKRLSREQFRLYKNTIQAVDVVIIVKKTYDRGYEISQEVVEIFRKINKSHPR